MTQVPLEVTALAAAGYCWMRVRGVDPVVMDAGVAKLNLLVIAFPLLFLLGASPLVVRILITCLPALRRRASGWSPAGFLAMNRLNANRGITALVLTAVAVPVGVFGFSVTLTATIQQTLEAKARVFVGSDRAISTFDDAAATAALNRISTRVIRYQDVTIGSAPVQVLAIDPDTFTRNAFWDDRFPELPLEELVALLAAGPGTGPLAALAVGARIDASSSGLPDRPSRCWSPSPGSRRVSFTVAISYERFDIDPLRPPTQLLTVRPLAYGLALVFAASVILAISAYAQRVTDRADESSVLRLAD